MRQFCFGPWSGQHLDGTLVLSCTTEEKYCSFCPWAALRVFLHCECPPSVSLCVRPPGLFLMTAVFVFITVAISVLNQEHSAKASGGLRLSETKLLVI